MNYINNILQKYGKKIIVVLDNSNQPWFNATQLFKILQYSSSKQAMQQLVIDEHVTQLKNIIKDSKSYKNIESESLFVNKEGLYKLLLRSKRKEAKKFFRWLVEIVMPSIRKNGFYKSDGNSDPDTDNEEFENIINKLQFENLILKNDTKDTGKYIYIGKPRDTKPATPLDIDTLKITKTINYSARSNKYDKDLMIILYRVKVDDDKAVDSCLNQLLNSYRHESNKWDFYKITLKMAIKMINDCIKLTKTKKLSEDNYYLDMIKNNSLPKYTGKYGFEVIFNNQKKVEHELQGGGNLKVYDDYTLINDMFNKVFDNGLF